MYPNLKVSRKEVRTCLDGSGRKQWFPFAVCRWIPRKPQPPVNIKAKPAVGCKETFDENPEEFLSGK
jgi:hypothetical protein